MKQLIVLMTLLFPAPWAYALEVMVCVSFSMPQTLLEATLKEAADYQIPVLLNGLIDNSMAKTAERLMTLSRDIPNLTLQIDPTAFERFGIQQVPALVVAEGHRFDVLYGNLRLKEGLYRLVEGDAGLTNAFVRNFVHD
ncbi:type-F conjugative transfer system pilin assembly protein TrbC [Legionella sp. 28fT52]|uniref:type-F conjugative transfer system pilin assembly protein TrbC n=1 Tax=Legionella sp. 28fT52 TaxID=3410134 RepID=UPI003AF68595